MPPHHDRAHAADLEFEYDSADDAALVAGAVRQEVGEIDGGRSTASLERDDRRVMVEIRAEDLVALRAGLNTWQTLVEVAERSGAVGDGTRRRGP
jgi:KEOPS complex subunit Pcc1